MVEGKDDRLVTVLYIRPPKRHLHPFTKMPLEPRKFQYMSAFVGKQKSISPGGAPSWPDEPCFFDLTSLELAVPLLANVTMVTVAHRIEAVQR